MTPPNVLLNAHAFVLYILPFSAWSDAALGQPGLTNDKGFTVQSDSCFRCRYEKFSGIVIPRSSVRLFEPAVREKPTSVSTNEIDKFR